MRQLSRIAFVMVGFGVVALGMPFAVAADRRGDELRVSGRVWVTERTPGASTVAAFDAATGELLGITPVGSAPIGVTEPKGTGKAYSADEVANQVSVIDAETVQVISTIAMGPRPHHLMASADGRLIYVAEYGRRTVGVIDTRTDTRVREVVASAKTSSRTHAVWITPDGRTLYATNEDSATAANGTISKIDLHTGAIVWELVIGNRPSEILVTPDGRTAYVSVRNEDKIKIVDLRGASPTVTGEVAIGGRPDTLQLTQDRKMLVVGLRSTPQVAFLDTRSLEVSHVTAAGYGISGHQWLSDNDRYTFIAMEGATAAQPGALMVIDNRSLEIVATHPYPTGRSSPHGVYFAPVAKDDDGDDTDDDDDDDDGSEDD